LWNSYIVKSDSNRIFFTGDTSYCNVFQQIGNKYGPFDLSFIPIGSYCPREYQKYSHIDPKEAIQIHNDLRSKMSIGMHFGTFTLTSEPILEPPKLLSKIMKEMKMDGSEFFILRHGQTITTSKRR